MRVNFTRTFAYLLIVAASAPACASRTTAATQPSPPAFVPGDSDPKAIELVDKMLDALGGIAAWEKVKQIRWEQKYMLDGEMTGWFRHSWDRWNGRHRFEQADMPSYVQAKAEGDIGETLFSVAMYDLLDRDSKGFASYGGKQVGSEDRDKIIASAYKNWQADTYRIASQYKTKDPGVRLKIDAELDPSGGRCEPKCTVVEVTFDPAVGEDTYYISINQKTFMPEVLEKVKSGGRLGFALEDWTTVGGLKFPTKLQNMGVAGEVFRIENIQIGDPEDELYIPQVR